MRAFFHELPKNFLKSFSGYKWVFHLLAAGLTYVCVVSGFDWAYFTHSRNTLLISLLFPAAVFGGLLPILAPLMVFIWGKIRNNLQLINTAWAMGQAALLGLVISSLYKALTGRMPPEVFGSSPVLDISRQFQFGFLRGGVFWGWPSSHTTIAFAMAATLIVLYPRNKVVKYLVLIYAFYIGFGVSATIHWFSEFLAGAIIGTVIGLTVGRSFLIRAFDSIKP